MQETLRVAEVDRILERILARPEFQPPEPAPLWRALGTAWRWAWTGIGELLEWLAPGLDAASPAWSLLARSLVVLLGLVGLGVLAYLARLGLGSLRRRTRSPEGGGPRTVRRTASEWEKVAALAAEEGRWRDAVIALYQTVIHRLAQDERLRLDPAKTPGDYRRELRGDPETGPLLDRFVQRWEPLAFGRREAGPGAWSELRALARALGNGE